MKSFIPWIFALYTGQTIAQPTDLVLSIPEAEYTHELQTPVALGDKKSEKPTTHRKKLWFLTGAVIGASVTATTIYGIQAITPHEHVDQFAPQYDDDFTHNATHVAPLNIFGIDDRILETSGDYPFSAIGRLTFETTQGRRSLCTGTLVGEDTVLTAAHCVENEQGQRYRNFLFSAGAIEGSANTEATTRITQILSDSRYANSISGEADFTYDWAILKLVDPIGKTQGSLGVQSRGAAEGDIVNLAGYSGDLRSGATLSVHPNCLVREDQFDGSYAYDCDSTGGSSGSGLTTQDFRYIFGIHSHNFCNGDCDIDAWPRYTRSARNVAARVNTALSILNRQRGLPSTTPIDPVCVEKPLASRNANGAERTNCESFHKGEGVFFSDNGTSNSAKLTPVLWFSIGFQALQALMR